MAINPRLQTDDQIARFVATAAFTLIQTGQLDAIGILGGALFCAFGQERGATIWHATLRYLVPVEYPQSLEETVNGQ